MHARCAPDNNADCEIAFNSLFPPSLLPPFSFFSPFFFASQSVIGVTALTVVALKSNQLLSVLPRFRPRPNPTRPICPLISPLPPPPPPPPTSSRLQRRRYFWIDFFVFQQRERAFSTSPTYPTGNTRTARLASPSDFRIRIFVHDDLRAQNVRGRDDRRRCGPKDDSIPQKSLYRFEAL